MLSKKQKRSLKEKGRIAFEEATHNLAEPIEAHSSPTKLKN